MIQALFHVRAHHWQTDIAIAILRIAFSLLMLRYGYIKFINFKSYAPDFMQFMGLSGSVSLGLVIFAEFFCALALCIGLLSRVVLVPLIVTMLVAFFVVHANDPFDVSEHPLVFLFPYLALLLSGPGRYSADYYIHRAISQ